MRTGDLIFLAAAAIIILIGWIAERHIEDESWQRKKRFRQEVQECYQRQIIRHRAPYCQIGYIVGGRRHG